MIRGAGALGSMKPYTPAAHPTELPLSLLKHGFRRPFTALTAALAAATLSLVSVGASAPALADTPGVPGAAARAAPARAIQGSTGPNVPAHPLRDAYRDAADALAKLAAQRPLIQAPTMPSGV